MKYVALGLVLGLAGTSFGQLGSFNSLVKTLRDKGVLKYQQILPVGEKNLPLTSKPLPAAAGDDSRDVEILHYGEAKSLGKDLEISDGVEIVSHGFRCLAESVKGNRDTQIFTFSGNVRIIGEDETVVGESVTVNFKNKTFHATYGKAQLKPNLLQRQVTGDVFVSGKEAFGDRKKVFGKDTLFTTCDHEKPHYSFDAESSTVEPNREAVLKKVKISVLGKTIITLPVLWIPLGDRSFKYLPQIGQSPDEGYYIKNTYGFPMRGDDRGAIRTDYMSKLGFGLGANYYYRNKTMNGITKVYSVLGNVKTVSISNQHEQRLGWATLLLDNDIQRNNYLSAPGSSIINTRAQLKFPRFTTFSFNEQKQLSNGFNSYNQTVTINDARQTKRTSTSLDVTFNRSGGSSGIGRETADVRFMGTQDVKSGMFSLEYQRTIPVGAVSNFFPSADKTPVLSFRTDSTKLFGREAFQTFPFRTEVSIGEYLDPILKQRFTRSVFDLGFNRGIRDKGNWRWDFNGDFRQTFASDDTAQYRMTMGQNVTYAIDKKVTFNIRYSYLRPFGYSPLAIDRTGNTNTISTDLSIQKNSKSSFGIQTGYDFIRGDTGQLAWQQVGIRSDYKLGRSFSFRTLTSYDTLNQVWSNFRMDTTWQSPTISASLGARYDGIRHTWSTINAYLDGIEYGKTKLGTVLNFNGYTGRFDSQQYNLVYDLHCAEAIFTVADYGSGFRAGREIGFFIRLKSIPFDSSFGRGRLGQVLGSGSGGRSF